MGMTTGYFVWGEKSGVIDPMLSNTARLRDWHGITKRGNFIAFVDLFNAYFWTCVAFQWQLLNRLINNESSAQLMH